MDWSKRINIAVDYFEANLNGEIALEKAAEVACTSKYHFHRMFFAITGVTPAEYVRKRRLTIAASDLKSGKDKIIDIAIRYGFESPNAFTRAFRSFHGVKPSEARTSQLKLRTFKRTAALPTNKGVPMLTYKIIEKPAFLITGKSRNFEFDDFVKNGPKFWKEYVATDHYKSLWQLTNGACGRSSETALMSVYFPNEEGNRDVFTDVLAVEIQSDKQNTDFENFSVPAATYAEFICTYQTSMKTNKKIYGEWFAATGYERDGTKPDIAAYFPVAFRPMKEMLVRWWIPVVKRG